MYFNYQIILPSGQVISESAEANSAGALTQKLEKDGHQVVAVQLDWRRTLAGVLKPKQLKRQVLVDFFHHMAGMLELGMNVTQALITVKDTLDDPTLKEALTHIEDVTNKGYSLSQAVEETGVFPQLTVASVSAAERANRLQEVFEELGEHYKRLDSLVSDAKKAATYPVVALCVLTLVFLGLLLYVIPQLKDVLPEPYPLITRVMITMSEFAPYLWWLPFVLPVVGFLLFKRASLQQKARIVQRLYRVPLAGRIALNLALSTMFMSLAMLNGGGIPLLETLKIVIAGTPSPLLKEKLIICRDLAQHGSPLSEGFRDPVFPPVVLRAIAHGEATGRFDKQFAGVAKFLRERTANQIQMLSTFIEPALILIGGTVLITMALGIFMPIYGSLQNMGR